VVLGRFDWRWLVFHDQTSITDAERSCPQACRSAGLSGPDRADLDHGCQLNQFRLVLVGVVLAEQQLCTRRQLRSDASGGAATVTAISPG
jgi:hypothetical protein